MYENISLKIYLDDLASGRPTPGGGSAAALEAAQGCALISMVLNFTISNMLYAQVKERASSDLERSESLRNKALLLAGEDARAFGKLLDGLKVLKKGTAELEDLYKGSCNVPLRVCAVANEAIRITRALCDYANKNLITDIAVAALILESAFNCARINVDINLKYITDKVYARAARNELDPALAAVSGFKEEILTICRQNI